MGAERVDGFGMNWITKKASQEIDEQYLKPNHWHFIDISLRWSCDLLSVDLQGNHYGEIPPLVTQANSKGEKMHCHSSAWLKLIQMRSSKSLLTDEDNTILLLMVLMVAFVSLNCINRPLSSTTYPTSRQSHHRAELQDTEAIVHVYRQFSKTN